jgi:hypothetical protein
MNDTGVIRLRARYAMEPVGAGRRGGGAAAARQRQRTAMNRPVTIRPKPIAKFHELRSFMIGTFSPAR